MSVAAKAGTVRRDRRQLETLVANEPDYEAFVTPLLTLAKQLKTDEIKTTLAQ